MTRFIRICCFSFVLSVLACSADTETSSDHQATDSGRGAAAELAGGGDASGHGTHVTDHGVHAAGHDAEKPSDGQGAQLHVRDAYMFAPAPGQKHGAVYLTLHNPSEQPLEVLDVATEIAGTAMIHRTFYEQGMMRMRHVHHFSLAPDETVVFEPNGFHIMLMDLAAAPAPGGHFSVRLTLNSHGLVEFDVEVRDPR